MTDIECVLRERNVVVHSVSVQPGDPVASGRHQPYDDRSNDALPAVKDAIENNPPNCLTTKRYLDLLGVRSRVEAIGEPQVKS